MKEKVFSNLLWRFGERILAQLISFVVTIVLARLLNPTDYGVVALLTVIAAILQVLVDGGFGNALIQKNNADDLDFSSVFYFNLLFCGILYLGLFFLAPVIAAFYNVTEMTSMLRVLGLLILISGLKNIQQAYISKTLQFRKFFWATLFGTLLSGAVGVALALSGAGAWALIAQTLTNASIDTIIIWFTVKWRPRWMFSFDRLKNLFSYGWKLLVSTLIDTVYGNVRQLIIGKIYSSSDLAYYNRGRYIPNLIVINVNTSIDSVLFPTMSNHQGNVNDLKSMAKRSIKVSNYIMSPMMMGIVFLAEPIIKTLLTEKWLPCVPFVRIFCILYMFQPIQTVNTNIVKALGYSDVRLKQEIITKVVGMLLLLISLKYGVLMIAYAYLLGNFINQFVNSFPSKRLIGYSYWEQLKDIMPSILLSIGMGIIVYLFSYVQLPILPKLVFQIMLGAVLYLFGSVLFKIDSFCYLLSVLKSFRSQ